MIRSIMAYVACITFSIIAFSTTPELRSPEDFVRSISKGGEKITYTAVSGDLNNDGQSDIAMLLHLTNGMHQGYRLAVLLGKRNGTFMLLNISKIGETSDGLLPRLKRIERNNIFIYADSTNGFWGTYQFRVTKSSTLLIGSTIHLSGCQSGHDYCAAVDTNTNFLTGDIIFKSTILGSSKPKMRKYRATAHFSQCSLDDFDFSPYFCMENVQTSKGILDNLMRGEN